MAAYLGQSEARSLSRQALHQRMNPPVITFLQSVLQPLVDSGVGTATGGGKLPFQRILLEDATQFRMHPKNHPAFRAVANNSGTTAGAKVDVVMDLISGKLLMQREVEGHVQDRTLGPGLLPMVERDDLVLRDMGYFDVAAFAVIEARHHQPHSPSCVDPRRDDLFSHGGPDQRTHHEPAATTPNKRRETLRLVLNPSEDAPNPLVGTVIPTSFDTRRFGPQLFDGSVELAKQMPHSGQTQQQAATHAEREHDFGA